MTQSLDVDAVMDLIFGNGHEFWRVATEETYRELASRLLGRFSIEDAAEILSTAHDATAGEFGA